MLVLGPAGFDPLKYLHFLRLGCASLRLRWRRTVLIKVCPRTNIVEWGSSMGRTFAVLRTAGPVAQRRSRSGGRQAELGRFGRCWWRSSCDPTGRAGRSLPQRRPATRRSRVENCDTSRASDPLRSNQSRIKTANKTPCGHRPGLPRQRRRRDGQRRRTRRQLVFIHRRHIRPIYRIPHPLFQLQPLRPPLLRFSVALPLGINGDERHAVGKRLELPQETASTPSN